MMATETAAPEPNPAASGMVEVTIRVQAGISGTRSSFRVKMDRKGDRIIQRQVLELVVEGDIRGDQGDTITAGAGLDDRFGLYIQHGDGDGGLAVDYGVLSKEDDLTGGRSSESRHN